MRGQVMLEYIVIFGVMFFIGVMYIATSSSLFQSTSQQQRVTALNDIGYMVQDEVILASSVDDGYVRAFTIPAKADRFVYNISNDGNTLTLTSSDIITTYPLPNVTGTFHVGTNTLKKNGLVSVT